MVRLALLSGLAFLVLTTIGACRQIAGIEERTQCVPRCDGDKARFTCDADGVATRVECPTGPCLTSTCSNAVCGVAAAVGETCGPQATGTCNEGAACTGIGIQLAARRLTTCARMHDGAVYCWGDNTNGQIGDGTVIARGNPTRVRGLPPVARVAVGYWNACGITAEGEAWCWGKSDNGQLGKRTSAYEVTPQKIEGLPPVDSIAIGEAHLCALTRSEEVYCWGLNDYEQAGVAAVNRVDTPTRVALPSAAIQISSSKAHTCAVLRGEPSLACWGWNLQRQLGPAAGDIKFSAAPISVELPSKARIVEVAVSARSTCALADKLVHCWGLNDRGQLGNGSDGKTGSVLVERNPGGGATYYAEPIPAPVQRRSDSGGLELLTYVERMIATDGSHVCVETSLHYSSRFWCWGIDDRGELGRGDFPRDHAEIVPYAILATVIPLYGSIQASGEDHTCAIFSPANEPPSIWCYGANTAVGSGMADKEDRTKAQALPAPVQWLPPTL
jgi:alpha-tubulin suppressor-like RCC1 family protein